MIFPYQSVSFQNPSPNFPFMVKFIKSPIDYNETGDQKRAADNENDCNYDIIHLSSPSVIYSINCINSNIMVLSKVRLNFIQSFKQNSLSHIVPSCVSSA